jgi:hypothetical protein
MVEVSIIKNVEFNLAITFRLGKTHGSLSRRSLLAKKDQRTKELRGESFFGRGRV